MRVAIFGKSFGDNFNDAVYKLFEKLNKYKVEILVYEPFFDYVTKNLYFTPRITDVFRKKNELIDVDIVFSVGGDGTILECVAFLEDSPIPILGINSGRLGFLANVSKRDIEKAIDNIINSNYEIEKRTLIQVITEEKIFGDFNCGLNELTVQKKDTSSMLSIEVFLNSEYMTTYWADGLIIATPTGSTAYSLSAGGPILVPGAENFVITAIAPHNLSVRPVVVPDNVEIKIIVRGRSDEFLVALDARNAFLKNGTELVIKKSDYKLNLIKLPNITFFTTLRSKLMWGIDRRSRTLH